MRTAAGFQPRHHIGWDVLCAARLAASDDPSGNNCGKYNQTHPESHPVPLPVRRSNVLNMFESNVLNTFKSSAAASTGGDSNRQAFHNVGGLRRRTSPLSHVYRIRRVITFFKSHPEYHGALTEAQDDLMMPLPFSAVEVFFGHFAEDHTVARPRMKRMRAITIDDGEAGGGGGGGVDSEDGDGAIDSDEEQPDHSPPEGGDVREAVAAGQSSSDVCRCLPVTVVTNLR